MRQMNASLKRLFILAIAAALGLLVLQIFWVYHEWKNTKEVLQRQIGYCFQAAVNKELDKRKDILKVYLKTLLSDRSFVDIKLQYKAEDNKWMITMYDVQKRKDYSSWTITEIPSGTNLTPDQKTTIIDQYVNTHLSKSIEEDEIYFYTQRFGKLWTDKYRRLKLDSFFLKDEFKSLLAEQNINALFSIQFTDSSQKIKQAAKNLNAFFVKPVSINYSAIYDQETKYFAVVYIYSPIPLVFSRLWLALFATLLMLLLTFYCLFRMYKTILQQKELHELKNDFIGNMTHELKTPIATVTAAIDALQYFGGLNNKDKSEKYLNTSRTELQRLNDIVSKVLNISIYERQLTELQKKPVNVQRLAKSVIQAFEVQTSKPFCFDIQCTPPDIHVMADEMHLKNVLHNLVDNAIKYVPDNLRLVLSASIQDKSVVLSIHDNGGGIEEKHMPHLFEKFYRVPSGNVQSVKGFGLGLFYVKQIIQQHGGHVQAHSHKNEGTTFTISLPDDNN